MHLAIDIGPDIARAAVLKDGRPRLIDCGTGERALPAIARQTMHGLVIGQAAALQLVGNAETSVSGVTRLLGGPGTRPAGLNERLAYAIRDEGGVTWCNLIYAEVSAPMIYGRLARTLVDAARSEGNPVDSVVLTVPAGAEHRFRVAARAALEAEGLPVKRIINQPAAALLAADLSRQTVAVINCGGGSTEATIATVAETIQIEATSSNMLLGSDDLAWAIADGLSAVFQHQGIDITHADSAGLARAGLRRAAGDALETLALAPEMVLVLDHGGGFGRDLATLVRQNNLDEWLKPHLKQIRALCQQALKQSKRKAADIETVLVIGEAAHLPWIQREIAAAFKRPVGALHISDAASLAVCGAALAGAAAHELVWDVTPYPLGINSTYGNQELFSPILAANTPIPTPQANEPGAFVGSYRTLYPDQTTVRLEMLQYRGERSGHPYGAEKVYPHECEQLGCWEFSGLSPKRGDHAAFTVTFSVDQDGIVHLTAVETATGLQLNVQTRSSI